jgi:hypothetical protein
VSKWRYTLEFRREEGDLGVPVKWLAECQETQEITQEKYAMAEEKEVGPKIELENMKTR